MRAVILAAGLGLRLGGGEEHPPKCLLRFEDRTLLARHLDVLERIGVSAVTIGTGYRREDVEAELERVSPAVPVHTVFNPDFRAGNVVTAHVLAAALDCGEPVLLMDADVLYHGEILERLAASESANCLALDRDFEAGDEPVKICLRGGRPVAFGKQLPAGLDLDLMGESVGFFKLDATMAGRLVARAADYVARGRRDAFYEDVLRDLMLETPGDWGHEDITGLPWIEIDYQEDIRRAENEVLSRINARAAA